MNNERSTGTARPEQQRRALQRVLTFSRRAAVRTLDGLRPVARLRPGDRLEADGGGGSQQVLWVAVGRNVQVFTGPGQTQAASEHPCLGRVSPLTGKLELRRPAQSGPRLPLRLH